MCSKIYKKISVFFIFSVFLLITTILPQQASAFNLGTATYDSVSFSVSSQDTSPYDMAFNADGTKMYVVSNNTDTVYQYSLSSAYDMSTASYDSVSLSVNAQDASPYGVAFNTTGTKMYIVGDIGNRVYQYTLSSGFDLSTASYDSVSFYVGSQDSAPHDVSFSTDGTKMFIMGQNNDRVYQYTLSSGFDLSTASYASLSLYVGGLEATPYSITFESDGAKMYMVGISNDTVYQYNLSSAFSLSGASYSGTSFSVSGQDGNPRGVTIGDDDEKLFILGAINDRVYQYSYTIPDVTAPTVDTLSPTDNATGVATNANLVITFDEAVDAEAGADNDIVIKKSSDNTTFATIDAQSGLVTGGGTDTITINPSSDLDEQTEYYVQIGADAFDDSSSNSFAGISDTTTWSFTTADETNPTISTLSPADDATDIAVDANLVITFDEAVDVESGNITIKLSADDTTVETIDVTGGQVTGTGTDTITINPGSDFSTATGYYVLIASTAFDDPSGNSFAGISATTTWNFTTVAAASSGGSSKVYSVTPNKPTISASLYRNNSIKLSVNYNANRVVTNEFGFTMDDGDDTTTTMIRNAQFWGGMSYSDSISDIECGTTYTFQAFVSNATGKVFSDKVKVTTEDCIDELDEDEEEVDQEEVVDEDTDALKTATSFNQSLSPGETGTPVLKLQKLLNTLGFIVATTGPGSPGNETSYYGALTQGAVRQLQNVLKITPADGYVSGKTLEVVKIIEILLPSS